MKRNLNFLFAFFVVLVSGCKRDSFVPQPTLKAVSGQPVIYEGSDLFIQKIVSQILDKQMLPDVKDKIPASKIAWKDRVMIGYLGDSLGHLLVPVSDSSEIVNSYLQISIGGSDSVAGAELVRISSDYFSNNKPNEKASRARELIALSKKGMKLPKEFDLNEARKTVSKYSRMLEVGKNLFSASDNSSASISLNSTESNCYMRFQIYYMITIPDLTPSTVNQLFYDRFDFNFNGIGVVRVFWPLSNNGGFNHVRYPSGYLQYFQVEQTISGIWHTEVVNWLGLPNILTIDEVYINDGCDDTGDGGGDTGGGGGVSIEPTPQNPNPPICNTLEAESKAEGAVNAGVVASEDMEVTTTMLPTMENGFLTRKRQYKWTFYKGSLLYMSWKYKAIEVGVHRFNNVTQDWYWHSFAHTGTSTEGATAFSTQLTITSTPQTQIDLYKIKAGISFPFTVSVTVSCPGGLSVTKTRDHNASYQNIDVNLE